MKKRFVLPKKILLPGGFSVRIQQVEMTTDETADFTYSPDGSAVLRMKRGMTQKQQRYYLSHELIHAMIDYHHVMVMEGAGP